MQLSWIDPEALRELAAKLQDPVPPPPPSRTDDPPSDFLSNLAVNLDPLGFTATEPAVTPPSVAPVSVAPPRSDSQLASIREQLQSIRAKALQAGLLQPDPPPAPEASSSSNSQQTPFPSAPEMASLPPRPAKDTAPAPQLEGSLGDRLENFARWAGSRVPALELLLVDDHGDVLLGSSSRSDLALSALFSLNAALRSSASSMSHPPPVIRTHLSHRRELTVIPSSTRHGTVTIVLVSAEPLPDDGLESLREALVLTIEGPST